MQALVYVARHGATIEPDTARHLRRAFLTARKDYYMDPGAGEPKPGPTARSLIAKQGYSSPAASADAAVRPGAAWARRLR